MKILGGWTKVGRTVIFRAVYKDGTKEVWVDFWDMRHHKIFYLFLMGIRKNIYSRSKELRWAPDSLGPKECSISFKEA